MLLVRGEPGIGKTALLEHAAGEARGMALLRARGIESEAEVPFAGLLELVRPALGELDRIPAPQAAALRGALALGPSAEADRFVIGAATLNLLACHAERSPLLVLVDDAHWFDGASLTALVFAARRLEADPIAVVFAVRAGEAPTVEEAGLSVLTLGGVDRETARELLKRHCQQAIAPNDSDRLFEATAGNPLALVELAATGGELGLPPTEGPLPIETSVERTFRRRIDRLSEPARLALLLAASDDSGQLSRLGRAADALGVDLSALEESERAGLVSIAYGVLHFRHPLVRSAAHHAHAPSERRAAHRALAESLDEELEPDRRAWHLASAAFGPDAATATALAHAGERARTRSAYAAAAAAFERAAHLTPEGGHRVPRLFAAAEAAWLGGQAERAMGVIGEALEGCADRRLRAELQHLRGHVAMRTGPVMEAHDILAQGAAEIEDSDPVKAVVMRAEAAEACVYAGEPQTMLATARAAWEQLPPDAGDRETFLVSFALGTALIYAGEGPAGAPYIRRAIAILERSDALSDDPRLVSSAAQGALWLREAEIGRGLTARAIALARGRNAIGVLPFVLAFAARDAVASAGWSSGEALAHEAIRLARDTGQALPLCAALSWLAGVEARQGSEDPCRRHLAEALALSERHGLGFFRLWALEALAYLELGLDRPDAAVLRLEEREVTLREARIADPDISGIPELIEAYVRCGRFRDAGALVVDYASRTKHKAQPWALARAARCHGLLADDGGFERHFAEALRLHALTPDRFEEARTRLCFGERLRRARRRAQARPELRHALDAFDALGASPWAERARVELLATGETARRRDVDTLDELTPQERRVAMILTEGKTTREAATQLFLSPKTVEYHLRHVYQKLGVRSREALADALAGEALNAPGSPERTRGAPDPAATTPHRTRVEA